jgi:hypothetical protein
VSWDIATVDAFDVIGSAVSKEKVSGAACRRCSAGTSGGCCMVYSLAFSLPASPVLYYGEEIGMAENLDARSPTACTALSG